MTTKTTIITAAVTLCAMMIGGCTKSSTPDAPAAGKRPSFSLAWSEYPSWSVFGVAETKGLINGKPGQYGAVEDKYNVDIVLEETDYDTCITMYASGTADAVCITNMDVLNPSLSLDSVAILPTSTSFGADALIVTGIDNVQALRGVNVYGLAKSVSEYTFVRNLELMGEDPKDHKFTNMDPAAAAQAMITGQEGYEAIVVWNPFVLETLKKRNEARVLFDSTSIPGEIIDMVAVRKESLAKNGGEAFAKAVIDAFYQVNEMIADPVTGDDTLVALGAKFSSLELEAMKKVVEQTRFYKTPDAATALFEGEELPETMKKVLGFCLTHDIVDREPTIAFPGGAEGGQLEFSTTYIKAVASSE